MVRTLLKVYMELGSYCLFLQEQIKDIIIKIRLHDLSEVLYPFLKISLYSDGVQQISTEFLNSRALNS